MDSKTKKILGWIIPIVAVVFLCQNDTEKDVKKHAATAITVFIADFIIQIAYILIPVTIPMFSTIINGLYVVCIILGIVAASKGEEPSIPGISNLAKTIFKKIFEA